VTGGGQTVVCNGGDVEIRGICRAVTLQGVTATTKAQIAAVTGPISIAGADGEVNIYGVCGVVTDNRTGTKTLSNKAVSQASINTEVDTALADYDGPTNTEFEARTLPAADYFDPATDAVANVTLVATTTDVTNLPSLDLTPVTDAIAALNDFDPATDVVANVALVDVTTTVTFPAPVDLTPVTDAIAALNDFDPATDVVANVALVDVTTTVTFPAPVDLTPVTEAIANLNDFDPATDVVANVALVDVTTELTVPPLLDLSGIPSAGDVADAVWDELVSEHNQSGSASAALTAAGSAGDPWTAILPGDYAEDSAGHLLSDLHDRLEEQVEEGPVIVLPAPTVGQTTAWCMCYDENGLVEEGVKIHITCIDASGFGEAYDGTTVRLISNSDGLAAGQIPRGVGLSFVAWRGSSSKLVEFSGVDMDTVEIPSMIGTR
jgi:hypothetical protein